MEEVKNEIKEEKPKRTRKQKVLLGLEIAGNVIFYIIIIFLFLFAIFNINGGNGTDNFPNIFGHGFLSVQSDSMYHEDGKKLDEWNDYPISDGFNTGDLLGADTFSETDTSTLHIGDVITFAGSVDGQPALITHRIVRILDNGKDVITQGDKAALESSSTFIAGSYIPNAYIEAGTDRYNYYKEHGMTDEQIKSFNFTLENTKLIENISVNQIRGVVTSVSAGGGKVLDNIQKNYLWYFVLPVGVLLLLEIFLVIRNIVILRGEKNKAELEDTREAMLKDVEAEKERIRQELLAEMRAQGLVSSEPEVKEEPKDDSTDTEQEEKEPDNIIDELDTKSEEDSSNE